LNAAAGAAELKDGVRNADGDFENVLLEK